ncbi:battenin-like [Calliphora vicina]|uniref:battenin-like n=1 Tax=Calliphora vicina TaxID=7373 RepID=UPI00325C1A19
MASENQDVVEELEDKNLWRDLTAFWILGLCNNYGYNVMLSAAHDIIGQFHEEHISLHSVNSTEAIGLRDCQYISTGAILLADILPTLFFKIILPFLPYWMNFYIIMAVMCSAAGFLFVGFAKTEWLAILGIAVTSASGGIGEAKFMSYSSQFNKNVVSTWSSGTGAAGVIGSLSYASLRSFHISNRDTMLIMLIFPLLEAVAFWLLLRTPKNKLRIVYSKELVLHRLEEFSEKMQYVKELLKYMVPLVLVYFFEYFINQGLYELVYFEKSFLDRPSQYRWLNVDYQLGVFIARSSVNIVHFKKTWLMAVLQFINVVYFLLEAIFPFTPTIWISFAVVLWEGLLGGGAYVNTFYRMSQEIPMQRRKFALAIVIQSDSIGITSAALLAIPVHNFICDLKVMGRLMEW